MLGPHDGKDAEFDEVRVASEQCFDTLEFFGGKIVSGDYFWSDHFLSDA